jgi:DUF438 domain-containing protein
MSNIIYLIGYSGTGKYTIAKELAKFGYIICDNQLINNPIFSLLNYDGFTDIPDYAWNAIGKIRNIILDFIQTETNKSYILTNVLINDKDDRALFEQVCKMSEKSKSPFFPIKLLITQEENIKRITQLSRRERWKSIDPTDAHHKKDLIEIVHPNLLELDVTNLSPKKAAKIILKHIEIKSIH